MLLVYLFLISSSHAMLTEYDEHSKKDTQQEELITLKPIRVISENNDPEESCCAHIWVKCKELWDCFIRYQQQPPIPYTRL